MKTPYDQGFEDGLLEKQRQIDLLTQKIGNLQSENRTLRSENDQLRNQVNDLITAIRRHNAGEITLVQATA